MAGRPLHSHGWHDRRWSRGAAPTAGTSCFAGRTQGTSPRGSGRQAPAGSSRARASWRRCAGSPWPRVYVAQEELGLDVRVECVLGVTHFFRGEPTANNEMVGVSFGCSVDDASGLVVSDEHSEHRWATVAEAAEFLPPGHWLSVLVARADAFRRPHAGGASAIALGRRCRRDMRQITDRRPVVELNGSCLPVARPPGRGRVRGRRRPVLLRHRPRRRIDAHLGRLR